MLLHAKLWFKTESYPIKIDFSKKTLENGVKKLQHRSAF